VPAASSAITSANSERILALHLVEDLCVRTFADGLLTSVLTVMSPRRVKRVDRTLGRIARSMISVLSIECSASVRKPRRNSGYARRPDIGGNAEGDNCLITPSAMPGLGITLVGFIARRQEIPEMRCAVSCWSGVHIRHASTSWVTASSAVRVVRY